MDLLITRHDLTCRLDLARLGAEHGPLRFDKVAQVYVAQRVSGTMPRPMSLTRQYSCKRPAPSSMCPNDDLPIERKPLSRPVTDSLYLAAAFFRRLERGNGLRGRVGALDARRVWVDAGLRSAVAVWLDALVRGRSVGSMLASPGSGCDITKKSMRLYALRMDWEGVSIKLANGKRSGKSTCPPAR